MSELRGSTWGPLPLPEFLTAQLDDHGFLPSDAAKCAIDLRNVPGRAAAASLFVDLGSCKFLEGDIDGAVAAWRQAITSDHDAAAARALLNMGLMYEHLHLYPRAVTVLSGVADRAVAPHEVPAALALARCQRAIGDTEAATETVALLASSTMAERPEAAELSEILLALGDLAHSADRPDRAERSWRIAVAGPDSPARRIAASRLLTLSLEQGHDDEFVELLATDDAEQSIPAAVLDRADGLVRLGQRDRTIELLESIEDQMLTSVERFRLAELRVNLGQVNAGIDQYEVLLGSPVPEIWQRAAFALGGLYRNHEMPDVAAGMFDRVRAHNDRYWSGKAALARGDLYAITGDYARAGALWAEASESDIAAVRASAYSRLSEGLPVDSVQTALAPVAASPTTGRDDDSAAAQVEPVESVAVDAVEREASMPESTPVLAAESVAIDAVEREASMPESTPVLAAESVVDEAVIVDLSALSAEPFDAQVLDLRSDSGQGNDAENDTADLYELRGDDASELEMPAPEAQVIALVDHTRVEQTEEAVEAPYDQWGGSASEPVESQEPVVVLLEPLEVEDAEQPSASPTKSVFARLSDLDAPVELADDVGSYHDAGISSAQERAANPYASLAPEGTPPPTSSASNPYAALAPSFDDAEFSPADNVEPGDWESLLDEPPASQKPAGRGRRRGRPSAFSRYT